MRQSPWIAALQRPATRVALAAVLLTGLALITLLGAEPSRAGVAEPVEIDTTIVSGPSEGSTTEAASPSFAFAATEKGSPLATVTFHCSVDGAPAAVCPTPFQAGPLASGPHNLSVYAENSVTHAIDATPAVRNFSVDTGEGETGGEELEGGGQEKTNPYPPSECKLRTARARVFTYNSRKKVRLVIHYTSFSSARVTVDYRLRGHRGGLRLGSTKRRFTKHGVYRRTQSLSAAAVRKVKAAKEFLVTVHIPGAPSYCERYYKRHLTIRRTIHGQVVWFQSDSIFGS